jgi:hypothetical protein
MPALATDVTLYLKRVRDVLRTGPGYSAAELTLGSGTSAVRILAQDPGVRGNSIQVAVTVPGSGTSGLTVSVSGSVISIALAVNTGVLVPASNTSTLIAAAINASAAASALVLAVVPPGAGTGSLSAAVAATHLSGGRGGEGGVDTLPLNFLRAQDMASALELLMLALNLPGNLTATGGTATSLSDTGAYVANTQVGNTVVFTGNVTAALAGRRAVVISNNANTLNFATGALPAAPAVGDTYTIQGTFVDNAINSLLQGRLGFSNAPPANVYGDSRIVADALVRIVQQLGGATISESRLFSGTTAAGSSSSAIKLNTRGLNLRIDELKNQKLDVTGFGIRKIISNDESTVQIAPPFSSAPGSGVTAVVTVPEDSSDASRNYTFAPGGQARDNRALAEVLRAAQAAVVAFVLPT